VREHDPNAVAFLHEEQANLREALGWALEGQKAEQAQLILEGAWFYWITSGLAAEDRSPRERT
jgi:hypothetical protein